MLTERSERCEHAMQIREFMGTQAKACVPEDSCAAAAAIMRRCKSGFVPIVDTHKTRRVIGVVTARDMMLQLVRLDRSARQVAVKVCMTSAPETISAEASLEEAARVMKSAAVPRLPVVERGRLVGVVSLQDMALAARRQWAYVGQHVTEQQVTEILEAIARRL